MSYPWSFLSMVFTKSDISSKRQKSDTIYCYMLNAYLQALFSIIFFYYAFTLLYEFLTTNQDFINFIGYYTVTELYFLKAGVFILALITLYFYTCWRLSVNRDLYHKHKEIVVFRIYLFTLCLALLEALASFILFDKPIFTTHYWWILIILVYMATILFLFRISVLALLESDRKSKKK